MAQTPARYAQKAIAFHFEFGSEIIENARYEKQTLYSLENLGIANEMLGRKKVWSYASQIMCEYLYPYTRYVPCQTDPIAVGRRKMLTH